MRRLLLRALLGATVCTLVAAPRPVAGQGNPTDAFIEIQSPAQWAPGARGILVESSRSLRIVGRAGHPAGVDRIVVNDVPFFTSPLADGSIHFEGYVPLTAGMDSVTVGLVAKDGSVQQERYPVQVSLPSSDASEPEQWASASSEFKGKRWAIVIGISNYENEGVPDLQFADRDAQEFASFLLSPQAGLGGFDQDKVLLLTNEDATYRRIRSALFTFLKNPTEDDVVYVFWAGHGSPDPDRLNDLYLLPYDADPNDIAATSVLMEDLQDAIRRTAARDRIVITDACHSAGVGFEGTRSLGAVNQINAAFLDRVAGSTGGTVVITSSEASQISREGLQWGGGHGVFTHFLVQGLRGDADENGDKIVDIHEMFEYVREHVKRETQSAQIPTISQSAFNPAWPMSMILSDDVVQAYQRTADLAPTAAPPAGRVIVDVLEGTWSLPDSLNAFVGVEQPVEIHLNGRAGPKVDGSLLSWASSNPGVARVTRDGTVIPASPGLTTIAASFYNEKRVELALRVYDRPLQVEFSPRVDSIQLVRGDAVRLSASMELPSGEIIRGVLPSFNVTDTLILGLARSDDDKIMEGAFKGLREGVSTLTATLAGETKTWTFQVRSPNLFIDGLPSLLLAGTEQDVRATYARPDGTRLSEALGVSWESEDTTVVSMRLGGVVARKPGRTTIVASVGSVSDRMEVTVLGDLLLATEQDGKSRIESLSIATGQSFTLLNDEWGGVDPSLSPDGSRIAFISKREGDHAPRVYVMDSDGSNIRRLTTEKQGRFGIRLGTYYEEGPNWSSDGEYVYFSSNRDGNYDIYRAQADTLPAEPERIVDSGSVERNVAAAPDGPRLAFERIINQRNSDVVITLGDGSEELNFTESRAAVSPRGSFESKPRLLPGSLGILYVERPDGGSGEGLARYDLSTRQKLAQIVRPQEGQEIVYAVSPRGDRVAYQQRPRRGRADPKLVISDVDGTALRTVQLPSSDRILSIAWGAVPITKETGGRR